MSTRPRTLEDVEWSLSRSASRSYAYIETGDAASLAIERHVQNRLLAERAELKGVTA